MFALLTYVMFVSTLNDSIGSIDLLDTWYSNILFTAMCYVIYIYTLYLLFILHYFHYIIDNNAL